MSIAIEPRADALRAKHNEVKGLESRYSRELRGLWKVHATIQNNSNLNSLIHTAFDSHDIPDEEATFLRQNALSSGPLDRAAILTLRSAPPTPTTLQDNASIYPSKPISGLAELTDSHKVSSAVDTKAPHTRNADISSSTTPTTESTATNPALTLPIIESKPVSKSPGPRHTSDLSDDADVAPATVAPPMPDEEVNLSSSTQQLLDLQASSKPAKVAHLPPEEVQEERLREREAEQGQKRLSETESRPFQHPAPPQHEVASSPSSTVNDSHSAATPIPPQDSPDTSPDSEAAQNELLPPQELRLSPEKQREKDEHDRILEAQKELARQAARGDVGSSADEQLRWEDRSAAAREKEEQTAREEVGGPEPDSKDQRVSTEAERVIEEIEVHVAPSTQAVSLPEGSMLAEPATVESQDDGDTIAVVPRVRAPVPARIEFPRRSEAASRAEKQATPASSRPERMTTRVHSGALRPKSVSEIMAWSHSPPEDISPRSSRRLISPEPLSPMTQHHPPATSSVSSALSTHLSRQQRRTSHTQENDTEHSSLQQLESLKGAAEDPERDYLEPLFRIQAHESPHSGTKTLPDLIKMVPKALSTEDHFTSLHERSDYKMLRRIYHLQNANKWSLRQMEKCKEPEQPPTHHDHMIAEMKWMRKDFRAERKIKKSVCAWLAQRCATWVAADHEERKRLQIRVKAHQQKPSHEDADVVPDLDQAGDSAPEDDLSPLTPRAGSPLPKTVVVAPELAGAVEELQRSGKLFKALVSLPKTGLLESVLHHTAKPMTLVSKFVKGKVLPKPTGPSRKRSRFDYEDEDHLLESEPGSKRLRDQAQPALENDDCALFHADNKPIRDRLHSNNAFRPPSEFIMPSTSFYEFRSGSQWIWEDDQKLRRLAKEYSFNWSLIADEMALATRYKGSAERRTPWECFERWEELESLPTDMRKTVYFKTWFQRLEQSQQASEKRYQQQLAHIQQQATQNGNPPHVPLRRRTTPTRVEKRRSTRYLWMVDGFRKLAKKREQAAWKQAETARVAATRKSQPETTHMNKVVRMTPQEFSKKRQECDMKALEQFRQQRLKIIEQQRQQIAMARSQQQQQSQQQNSQHSVPAQQRPQGAHAQQAQMQANGQSSSNVQALGQQQARSGGTSAPQRHGLLAPPQVNGQGIPQAQMQARAGMSQHPSMQQVAQASAQGRGSSYQMGSGSMQSPGAGGFTTQQQLQQNQALLAAFQQQQANNASSAQNMNQNSAGQQMIASPSMPPPPTPQNNPQQLSSGHIPQIIAIQNQIRVNNPGVPEDQLKTMATQQMKLQSQSSNQARQNAMNAAAGLPSQSPTGMQQQYASNQGAYHRNGQMANGMNSMYMNGDGNIQQAGSNHSPSQQQIYQQKMWQRQMQQMHQSPNTSHAQLNGSPSLAHASPNMTPGSPSMQFSNLAGMTPVSGMNNQRPPSRSNTPQMQRLGSSGSGMNTGMQSPGALQASPRNMQASMAR